MDEQTLVGQVTDARHETEAQQVHQGEHMVGETGRVGVSITMLRNIIRPKLSINSPEASPFLSHLDDDLAFCTSFFDVSQSLFGRFEWKDPIHNWAYDPRIDERTDLAQLVSAWSHEKK